MNSDLMKAILSMDAYNRGYDAGITFGNEAGANNSVDDQGTQVGTAIITRNSSDQFQNTDQNISFYALAYEYNGETVISYLGTDNPLFDANTGYGIGAGLVDSTLPLLRTQQGDMALQFYNKVDIATTTTISMTGHFRPLIA